MAVASGDAAPEQMAATLNCLGDADHDALSRCDLEGMSQAEYARLQGLSLPAATSRLQRARKKLGDHITPACQVRFDGAGKLCCFLPRSPVE